MTTVYQPDEGLVQSLAKRHGIGADAVRALMRAMAHGNGRMAQFNHPELGGMGQWSQGGLLMIGDIFNDGLKARVAALCADAAQALATEPAPAAPSQPAAPAGQWWGADLGKPAASGAQQGIRYAYFAATRRLAVERNGQVTIYDTLDHQITGVSQQQSDAATLHFTSQHGPVAVDELPVVG